jgi:nicotinate phosphoribosyltransferase
MSASGGVSVGIGDHLLVDLYELTMLQGYVAAGMVGPASFELFVRRLPGTRNILIAAGLEQALEFLDGFALSEVEVARLALVHRFSSQALQTMRDLRFSGDVDAVPEGTVVFANEPLISITAPLPEGQIVETRLTNLVHFPRLGAS